MKALKFTFSAEAIRSVSLKVLDLTARKSHLNKLLKEDVRVMERRRRKRQEIGKKGDRKDRKIDGRKDRWIEVDRWMGKQTDRQIDR